MLPSVWPVVTCTKKHASKKKKHAPKKKKLLRGNNKPHIAKTLCQTIMKRLILNNKTNKTKLPIDFRNYKKRRKYEVDLSKNTKFE